MPDNQEAMRSLRIAALLSLAALCPGADKEILLIAGAPSHPSGQHEHNAGVLLLQKWLSSMKGVHASTSLNGAWPESGVLERAHAIFFFFDGSGSHLVFKTPERTEAVAKAAARGAGLMFYHYATEPPPDKGAKEMLGWIGGYFELNYSVNPHWDANFQSLPRHPVTRGVKPFSVRDEWYFNVRFPEQSRQVSPILVAVPPKEAISDRDGPRLGNRDVRSKAGQPQTVVWAIERSNKGRGIGWTGGHHHRNLGDANFRKLLLNSLLWIAKADVPRDGVEVSVTDAELSENLDPKPARGRD
jgi:hypothetical protein